MFRYTAKKGKQHYMNKQQEHLQTIVKNYRPIEQLIPPHWSEGDIFANSIRQHYYRTGGEKPPLLLLHGFNEYGLTWLRVSKELERDYDIIMLDARGHGRSDGIASGFSNSLLVEDVVGVIRAFKLDRPPSSDYLKVAQRCCASQQHTRNFCTPSSSRVGAMKINLEHLRTRRATWPGTTPGLPGLNN